MGLAQSEMDCNRSKSELRCEQKVIITSAITEMRRV